MDVASPSPHLPVTVGGHPTPVPVHGTPPPPPLIDRSTPCLAVGPPGKYPVIAKHSRAPGWAPVRMREEDRLRAERRSPGVGRRGRTVRWCICTRPLTGALGAGGGKLRRQRPTTPCKVAAHDEQ
ncbi:hypothetical protein GCM10022206_89810 [Streptomyces chiangmaiensis]